MQNISLWSSLNSTKSKKKHQAWPDTIKRPLALYNSEIAVALVMAIFLLMQLRIHTQDAELYPAILRYDLKQYYDRHKATACIYQPVGFV